MMDGSKNRAARVGDRVLSLDPHAGNIIGSWHPGTICGIEWFKWGGLFFVSWDDAHGNLKNYPEYGITDHSGWSVNSWEVELDVYDEQFHLAVDDLFTSV